MRKNQAHHPPLEGHNKPIIIFLTVCTQSRKPVLANERMHRVVVDSWVSTSQWKVGRCVVMPDHIHLFCSPSGKESESVMSWTAYWKRLVSQCVPELKPLWQRDCWDTQLRHHESYSEKWSYVMKNPLRAGLIQDVDAWPFQGEIIHLSW